MGLTVYENFRSSHRHLNLCAGFRDGRRFASGIVRYGCSHLLEHGAQRNEQGAALDQRCKHATLLKNVGFAVDVMIVVEDRDLPRWWSSEACGRRRARLSQRSTGWRSDRV